MSIPKVEFKYMHVDDIIHACEECVKLSTENLKCIFNNYACIQLLDAADIEIVTFPQILYYDIENEPDEENRNIYHNYYKDACEMYNKECVDIIVTRDLNSIIGNIKNILNFLIKVYNTDTMEVIFEDSINVFGSKSTYPKLIYLVLLNNFIIKHQRRNNNIRIITIEKRSNENVNNAN